MVRKPLLIVALVVVVAVVVGAASLWPAANRHAPATDQEKVIAAYAMTYARTLEVGRADFACQMAARAAADKLGCGSPRQRARPACGSGPVKVGDVDNAHAIVYVGACRLSLAPTENGWRVIDDVRE